MSDANAEAEPTMEEILSSIRRIISEDDDPAADEKPGDGEESVEEILEPDPEPEPPVAAVPEPEPEPEPEPLPEPEPELQPEPLPDPDDDILELDQLIEDDGSVTDLSGGPADDSLSFDDIPEPAPPPFDYASKEAVGVATPSESFLAELTRAETVSTSGLITKANGLRPAHPYIGGSGDHVNSTHMGEVGRQFGALLLERPLINRSGEMVFSHYVELGTPFDVELLAHDEGKQIFSLIARQAGRDCTRITMQYAFAEQG